jgi:hypothetical protein
MRKEKQTMKANEMVSITLTQYNAVNATGQTDRLFRIEKLVGEVKVFNTGRGGDLEINYVGDVLSEREAESLARIPHYRVTVTPQKAESK